MMHTARPRGPADNPLTLRPVVSPEAALLAQEEFRCGAWSYFTCDDNPDDDCRKIGHLLVHEDTGETLRIDFTPYRQMTREDVQRWLDLGRPQRQDAGPLRTEQLELMWWRRFGSEAMLAYRAIRAKMGEFEVPA